MAANTGLHAHDGSLEFAMHLQQLVGSIFLLWGKIREAFFGDVEHFGKFLVVKIP